MAGDINRVVLVGRLTRDPEVRHLPSGSPVLQLGLAVNGRQKDEMGNWSDKPNFFDVKLFGPRAESLAPHLAKGKRIGVDGRLDWSSWETPEGKRSKVEVVAFDIQFLDSREPGGGMGGGEPVYVQAGAGQPSPDDFKPSTQEDDIPF